MKTPSYAPPPKKKNCYLIHEIKTFGLKTQRHWRSASRSVAHIFCRHICIDAVLVKRRGGKKKSLDNNYDLLFLIG